MTVSPSSRPAHAAVNRTGSITRSPRTIPPASGEDPAAQTVFYLLLLSIGEHLNFTAAYLLSAAVTTGLVVFYTGALLSTWKKCAMTLLPLLAGLYVFLYASINSEDYALLIGSAGLFSILAGVMVLTRKIDWFSPGTG